MHRLVSPGMNALGSSVKKSCVLIESCFNANFRSETLKLLYFKSYSRNKKNIYREYSSLYKPTKQNYFNLSWLLMRLVLKWLVRPLVRLLCKHLELGNKIYPSFFKIHSLSACINSDIALVLFILNFFARRRSLELLLQMHLWSQPAKLLLQKPRKRYMYLSLLVGCYPEGTQVFCS